MFAVLKRKKSDMLANLNFTPHFRLKTVVQTLLVAVVLFVTLEASENEENSNRFELTFNLPRLDTPASAATPQVCASARVPPGVSYVTGLKPLGRVDKLHHMIVFTCEEPGYLSSEESSSAATSPYYSCLGGSIEGFPHGSICPPAKQRRVYGWENVPTEFHFPEGIGVEVGNRSKNLFFVFNLHYKSPPGPEDDIGMTLFMSKNVSHGQDTIYLHAHNFSLPPMATTYVSCATQINAKVSLNAFAFHPHTHSRGRVVSGYRVRSGSWTLIGQAAPYQQSEPYPIGGGGLEIRYQDVVAIRCKLTNDGNTTVHMGPKDSDEMCMFTLYFTVNNNPEGSHILPRDDPDWNSYFPCLGEDKMAEVLQGTSFPREEYLDVDQLYM